ncbi:MAG: PKD domain-containing protein [Bacteroidia bacterium]
MSSLLAFTQNAKSNWPPPSVQNLPPEANFSWLHACLGDSTCFINQTIRGNTYTWTVTDTNSHHPTTLFTSNNDSGFCFLFAAGSYNVTLEAYNNHYVSITKLLTIDTVTKADFAFIHCGNNFINTSSCASSFYWDFGDGTTSTLSLPNHQFPDTGSYNVTLIAYKGSFSDTLKKLIKVDVTAFASGAFTYTLSNDTVSVHATFGGANTNYYWTWADGTYSTGRDTFHVYKDSTASYAVELYAINSCGPSLGIDTINILQQVPAIADFYFTGTCFGDSTCFTNLSAGGITYTWTISDITGAVIDTSTNDSAFCFLFPSIGSYSVTLDASNGFSVASVTKAIVIDTMPHADFYFKRCSNRFFNQSTCSSNYYWDFGDGTNSTLYMPSHQYADTGRYQVKLIAYNGILSDTLTQQIHIEITSLPNAGFTTVSSNDTLWVHANYSSVPNATYNWNFGDGTTGTGKDTLHIYADAVSSYIVTLTVYNLCGAILKTDSVHIIVPEPPPHLNFNNTTLAIAPNPVSNNSYLEAFYSAYADDKYLCHIYSSLGQKMYEGSYAFTSGINGFKISTTGFSEGMYVLTLQSGNSFVRKKFYIARTP